MYRRTRRSSSVLPIALAAAMSTAAAAATDTPAEDWTARFQTTYVWQRKPGFDAPYSGPNSLRPERERSYTFTTTAYLGFRPWQGGELYLNPEVTTGVPFSGLTGVAGFTNGEITRTAGPHPTVYRQRLFLRQTWNLGGDREAVESGLNQMAGAVDRDRFVLTAGNFSTLDVFDGNAYAKDPRTQFMNWGSMTHAAYDYAADARGFGWGFAAEWYQGDWVLRFGRMTGPRDPNALPIDYAIGRHYGDQVEVEHAHTLAGRPGKVRVLAWRNRARLARFDDALAWLRTHPGGDPQAILAVRNTDQTKYGLGINLEQAVNDRLGLFLRTMKADGRSETHAFTEADASFAAGAALQGTDWGRPRDTVGVSLMRNSLSRQRRDYLAAGGLSYFIGDGALAYRPERTVEAYYSLALWQHASLTADYQHMSNPAYNADRGPARFVSLRFHAEF